MGFWDSFTDLIEAATPWSTVEAEAVPRGGTGSEKTPADKDDGGEGEAKDPSGPTPDKRDVGEGKQVGGKAASGVDKPKDDEEDGGDQDEKQQSEGKEGKEEEQEGEGEEEEEEEEEETVDPKEKFEEECKESKACASFKHHFDECVERVTGAEEGEKKGPHEDCVEEFFHLAHCANQCAAPKVFAALK